MPICPEALRFATINHDANKRAQALLCDALEIMGFTVQDILFDRPAVRSGEENAWAVYRPGDDLTVTIKARVFPAEFAEVDDVR